MKHIRIYCDGSGNTFDSDGGWAYRILVDQVFKCEDSGYIASATNNVAELQAAISGLERAKLLLLEEQDGKNTITLISDSQLTLGYASGKYKCKALHLTPYYLKIRDLYEKLNVKCEWVKGHSGQPDNEACDKLAKAARESKGV